LSDEKIAKEWALKLSDPEFQSKITGITIIQRCNVSAKCDNCGKQAELHCKRCGHISKDNKCKAGAQYSLSRPSMFNDVTYVPQVLEPNESVGLRGGEKVICSFGGMQLVVMSHANQPAIKISFNKFGKQRYNPNNE
jgi:predicted RNA-binding Zn-ribbon protein involved in translation (DUF1610 family)